MTPQDTTHALAKSGNAEALAALIGSTKLESGFDQAGSDNGIRHEQSMVAKFHVLARQPDPTSPTMPSEHVQNLRLALHQEEAIDELRDAFASGDIVKVADSIGDALYVVLGTACACGIDIQPIFREIHRSNLTKFIDGTFREDGKYLKGPSYERANLAPIIEAQTRKP